MEQRVSLITLGVDDIARARGFYERLGWRGQEVDETVFFDAGGVVLVLWGREKLALDSGVQDSGAQDFDAVVLAHNVRSEDEVRAIANAAAAAGGTLTRKPGKTFYGGYAACFRDLDGHLWEIAYNPGFGLDKDGTVVLPSFSPQPVMEGEDPSEQAIYDVIGTGYARFRRSDPRIAQRIHRHLGNASTVLNVGAGAGSYEPPDRRVIALEPSAEMIRQRPAGAPLVVRGTADAIPFAARTFEAAMAVLTVHHWSDPMAGLAELRRVTKGPIVVLTFDNEVHSAQWLVTEYLPSMAALDSQNPTASAIVDALGGGTVESLPVPHDCIDGFCHAWWRRPAAYLDPAVRAGISGIARLPKALVDEAMARLDDDLASGAWHNAHEDLSALNEIDAGYRIVVSRAGSGHA